MNLRTAVCITWLLGGLANSDAEAPVLRVLKGAPAGLPLLRNGDFEEVINGNPSDWTAAPQGFSLVEREGRGDSRALRCESAANSEWRGASQTLTLNRTNIAPLVVRGYSRANEISGSPDSGYSLYADILYSDGTPLWGRTANFRTGTHDWEKREFLILPEKPVRSLTLHCLLRGHSGTAWFDDVMVEEVGVPRGVALYQGVPIRTGESVNKPSGKETRFSTKDGFGIKVRGSTVSSLQILGHEFAVPVASGFLVRDVAADSDFYGFNRGRCSELGLDLETTWREETNHIVVEGRLSDKSGRDRAITLVFALPIDAMGWRWGDDIRRNRIVEGAGEYSNNTVIGCGSTGTLSLYPLAALSGTNAGIAIALDMAQPAQYRVGYHAGAKQLYLAYDFGLTPDTRRFPGSAAFRFVIFRFDPQWGFRSAFQKFREIFPSHFAVRSRNQGIWMPFTDISTIKDWQDFGIRYHEGNNNVAWDDSHDILSFRYTEPMTWWMAMPRNTPRRPEEAVRQRDRLAQDGAGQAQRMAKVSQIAAMWDDAGQPGLAFRSEPWCDGVVWSMNPNPALTGANQANRATNASPSNPPNAATIYWDSSIKQELYGPGAKGRLDGEYLDSLEGYVTTDLNFRREHFQFSSVPLTFAADTRAPALQKGLAVFEFTKWLSEDVHRMGKLMFANGVPYRFTWLCPWLDVLGTETDWLQAGEYHPATDSQMCLWRTMAGGKPYLLLLNTDFDRFTPDLVEKYFQRSLFYGMYPSMFSHNAADNPYWQNPKWYDRDRALFKRYQPLIRRVAEAGWEPITSARCDNLDIWLERFGRKGDGTVFVTSLNGSASRQRGRISLDESLIFRQSRVLVRDAASRRVLAVDDPFCDIELDPHQVVVIELTYQAR